MRAALGVGVAMLAFAVYLGRLWAGPTMPRNVWNATLSPGAQAAAIAEARQPLVLTSTPCNQWRALVTWAPLSGEGGEYLTRRVRNPLADIVVQKDSRSFRYWSGGTPLSDVASPDEQTAVLPLADLLTGGDSGHFMYYSRPVVGGEFAPLTADLEPRSFLFVDRSEAGNSTNVWLGGQGVVTETHYDMSHNFYLQLDGTKRFELSPPSAYRQLRLHPWIHPLGIFTQRGAEECKDLPECVAELPSGHTIELQPGELLYIPPFWFHRVIAPTDRAAISVNVWSESQEGELRGLVDVPPPSALFEEATDELQRRMLLVYLVWALLRAVLSLDERQAQDFLRDALVQERLRPHFELLRCSDSFVTWDVCAAVTGGARLPPEQTMAAQAHAAHVARVFGALEQQQQAVHEIVLLNMIESLATDVLGDGAAEDGSRGVGSCVFFRCMAEVVLTA